MPARVDAQGMKFGSLTVVERRGPKWLCKCECGREVIVDYPSLKKGNTKTCGCSRKKDRPRRRKGYDIQTRLYRIWSNMKTRCTNNSDEYKYSRYGGRGIKYTEEWKQYASFNAWAESSGYADTLTLDRIDNDGDYTPENCRWITMKEQCKTRTKARGKNERAINTLAQTL